MIENVNHISINDLFWVQFKSYLVSFGHTELPPDVHFTIVFDEKLPDVNIHVTRNVSDPTNKPKIRIVEINKELLISLLPAWNQACLKSILKPIDLSALKSKSNGLVGFIPNDRLKGAHPIIEKNLKNHFENNISFKKRKTQIKIDGDLEKQIELFSASEEVQNAILNRMILLPKKYRKALDSGLIVAKEEMFHTIRVGDKWYRIEPPKELFDLLTIVMKPELANTIIAKMKDALEKIKTSNSYAETKHLDIPVRIILKKKES